MQHKSCSTRLIVYHSRATGLVSDVDLYYLLAQAQERNELADVTGLLVFDRGAFIQWLEGPKDGLETIWGSIRADRRHHEISLLADEEITQRRFNEWSMRFAHRDSAHTSVVSGFVRLAADFADRLHADIYGATRLIALLGRDAYP